jgi:hypothetical protein
MRLPRTGYRLLCGCLVQGTDSYAVASYRVQIEPVLGTQRIQMVCQFLGLSLRLSGLHVYPRHIAPVSKEKK